VLPSRSRSARRRFMMDQLTVRAVRGVHGQRTRTGMVSGQPAFSVQLQLTSSQWLRRSARLLPLVGPPAPPARPRVAMSVRVFHSNADRDARAAAAAAAAASRAAARTAGADERAPRLASSGTAEGSGRRPGWPGTPLTATPSRSLGSAGYGRSRASLRGRSGGVVSPAGRRPRTGSAPPEAGSAPPAALPSATLAGMATSELGVVALKGGRAPLFRRDANALVYAAAVERAVPRAGSDAGDGLIPGDPVAVVDAAGLPIALGFYNPLSVYAAVRILRHCPVRPNEDSNLLPTAVSAASDESIGPDRDSSAAPAAPSGIQALPKFFIEKEIQGRVNDAFAVRMALGLPSDSTDVFRAINGEGDRLSGIAVDVFASTAVIMSSALWVERFREVIEPAVTHALKVAVGSDEVTIVWRQAMERLRQDGLDKMKDAHYSYFPSLSAPVVADAASRTEGDTGNVAEENVGLNVDETLPESDVPSAPKTESVDVNDGERLIVRENDVRYVLPMTWLRTGQKSGFYADQSEHRRQVRMIVERRRSSRLSVLDCYCYCGGFALSAALGGAAHVTAVDSSATSIRIARENSTLNNVEDRITWVQSDVPRFMRQAMLEGKKYDLIILDPPKFAPSKSTLERATSKYLKINAAAIKLVSPGGLLLTVRAPCRNELQRVDEIQVLCVARAVHANI
jgi:23S rRNA G2069 N7-methylase RlmK/C1962 C5-methylase RlmI